VYISISGDQVDVRDICGWSQGEGAASDKVKEALLRAQAEREEALLQVGRPRQCSRSYEYKS
jgi:hypothetical protein